MAATFGTDRSRLVTWASNRKSGDKALQYADVVSFNSYPGWYGGGANTVVSAWQWDADWVAQHWPTKPFIISETGAGGIAGNHSAILPPSNATRWSEEYQAVVDALDAGVAMNDSNIAGIALWQFTDSEPCGETGSEPTHLQPRVGVGRWPPGCRSDVSALAADVAPILLVPVKVDQPNSSSGRPGGINNKGVLDQFRNPKLSAARVAALFGLI